MKLSMNSKTPSEIALPSHHMSSPVGNNSKKSRKSKAPVPFYRQMSSSSSSSSSNPPDSEICQSPPKFEAIPTSGLSVKCEESCSSHNKSIENMKNNRVKYSTVVEQVKIKNKNVGISETNTDVCASSMTTVKSSLSNNQIAYAGNTEIKSYSDFMRNLAAKYNNNDYYTPPRSDLSTSLEYNNFSVAAANAFKIAAAAASAATLTNNSVDHNATTDRRINDIPSSSFMLPYPAYTSTTDATFQMNPAQFHQGSIISHTPGAAAMIDPSATGALINMAMARSVHLASITKTAIQNTDGSGVVHADSFSSPLDLSSLPSSPEAKKPKLIKEEPPTIAADAVQKNNLNTFQNWTVSDVSSFVASIDICKEYAQKFKEANIDGTTLPLLDDNHLTGQLGLKLGPALKLRSIITKRLNNCQDLDVCQVCSMCQGCGFVEEIHDNTRSKNQREICQIPDKISRNLSKNVIQTNGINDTK